MKAEESKASHQFFGSMVTNSRLWISLGCLDWGVSCFSSVIPGRWRDSTSVQTTTAIIQNHLTIRL